MTRFLAAACCLGLLVACQNETHPSFSPQPSPSPHTQPTAAILQPADVPAGLVTCIGSGPIDVYLATLDNTNPALASRTFNQWDQLVTDGARGGALSIYAASSAACSVELGATTSVKSVTSLVAIFGDSGQADRAWESGVFGFAPPATGEVAPGLTRGSSTGLGLSSFTFVRPPVLLAAWHRSVFVALVIVANLDPGTFSAATAAVDARLN